MEDFTIYGWVIYTTEQQVDKGFVAFVRRQITANGIVKYMNEINVPEGGPNKFFVVPGMLTPSMRVRFDRECQTHQELMNSIGMDN
jgi:hypothetical protein